MRILTVIGARPQFIKAAALSRIIRNKSGFEEKFVHTGQHYDANMSEVFFEDLSIPRADYNLGINGGTHGQMTGSMLSGIEKIILKEQPDLTLVYGDTNSTLAGALASVKCRIPVVHIEAGLRSFNNHMPEEINRVLTDRISRFLYCPNDTAIHNLEGEGLNQAGVVIENSGDIMLDAALFYKKQAREKSTILNRLGLGERNYVLATLHRAENTDSEERIREIISALEKVHQRRRVVLPLHPRTASVLKKKGIQPSFDLIDPVGYLDMIELVSNSELVLTDSGGLQKEAYFFDKFCITLREETEWVELVQGGYNRVVGANTVKILQAYEEFSANEFTKKDQLYGAGNTAEYISNSLQNNQDKIKF